MLGSLKLSQTSMLAVLLYALLATAAFAALLSSTRADLVPGPIRLGAPIAFGAFLLLFALYRFALVRARRYPAGKAFFQVGASAIFLTLLLPSAARELRLPEPRQLESLVSDPDPAVRALACEVARSRPDGRRHAAVLVERLSDPAPEVRRQAKLSLEGLAGSDLGGEGPEAIARWKSWAASSGQAAPARP